MKKWTLPVLALIVIAIPVMTACSPPGQPDAPAEAESGESVTSVQTEPVTTGDIAMVYDYTGDLQSQDSVTVMPGAAGEVLSVLVEVGDQLLGGDPIAILDSEVYDAQGKQAQASLDVANLNKQKMVEGTRPEQIAAAQAAVQFARDSVNDLNTIDDDERTAAVAALAQAEAAVKLAQSEYDKVSWAGQVQMMPQALQLEQATIGYEAAKAAYELQTNPSDLQLAPLLGQLAQAEMALALAQTPFTETDFKLVDNQIKLAEVAVELAQIQIDATVIEAPFDGVVAELYVTQGSTVAPGAPVALFVSDAVEVVIDVEESRIGQVEEGMPASFVVAAYPDQEFPAVVTTVAPVADQTSHTFAVTVIPADGHDQLRSGMFAKVALLVDEMSNTTLVPRQAIVDEGGQQYVYVVKDDDTVEQRAVSTGLSSDGHVEVLSGLTSGEQVVVAGQSDLYDGAKVEVNNPS